MCAAIAASVLLVRVHCVFTLFLWCKCLSYYVSLGNGPNQRISLLFLVNQCHIHCRYPYELTELQVQCHEMFLHNSLSSAFPIQKLKLFCELGRTRIDIRWYQRCPGQRWAKMNALRCLGPFWNKLGSIRDSVESSWRRFFLFNNFY